jgi:hypothetical protein
MHSMDHPPPSVNHPEAGLALLPRDQLPQLRSRYEELLREFSVSPAAAYFRGILTQIDFRLQKAESA